MTRRLRIGFSICLYCFCAWSGFAQSQYESSTDFAKYAIKLRENGLLIMQGKQKPETTKKTLAGVGQPLANAPLSSRVSGIDSEPGRYPWRLSVMTTIFWIGERPTTKNPVPNDASSWDPNWSVDYGGYDDPDLNLRKRFVPMSFFPRQNPFYVALPYNDVQAGHTKPEAKDVIPWFKETFVRDGQSVLKSHWLAIRHNNRVCYAQWEDCGPFCTDHWQYVFGNERPRPNLNQGAGLDVSPAVRDYLGLANLDSCDWKFVDFREVPPGPWAMYGDNNSFVLLRRQSNQRFTPKTLLSASMRN